MTILNSFKLVNSSGRASSLRAVSRLVALVAVTLFVVNARAAVLGTYDFAGTGTTGDNAAPTAANVTFGSFTRVGVNSASVSDQFGSSGWTTGGTRNVNEYVQFVVTPGAGFSLNVEQLSFQVQGVDSLGGFLGAAPTSGQVSIFRNSNLGTAVETQTFTPSATLSSVTFNFTDFNSGVGDGVTVRFYGWNAQAGIFGLNLGQLNFDSVAFSATVVPEPVNVALGVFGTIIGFASLGGWLRKRKAATKAA
jgi:hypothetical protein